MTHYSKMIMIPNFSDGFISYVYIVYMISMLSWTIMTGLPALQSATPSIAMPLYGTLTYRSTKLDTQIIDHQTVDQ